MPVVLKIGRFSLFCYIIVHTVCIPFLLQLSKIILVIKIMLSYFIYDYWISDILSLIFSYYTVYFITAHFFDNRIAHLRTSWLNDDKSFTYTYIDSGIWRILDFYSLHPFVHLIFKSSLRNNNNSNNNIDKNNHRLDNLTIYKYA